MTDRLVSAAADGGRREPIDAVQERIICEMAHLDDPMDKYEHLVRLGRALGVPDGGIRSDEHAVAGCQTRVWIRTEHRDGLLHIAADSEAVITRGIIALILRILDRRPPAEILSVELHAFDAIGLSAHLSPARADGLAAMLRRIRDDARQAAGVAVSGS